MRRVLCIVLCICGYYTLVSCEEGNFFLKAAAKSVPRIGRSPNKQNNADFEKFFLKASKSVPRIGRRNEGSGDYNSPLLQYGQEMRNENLENYFKFPPWHDIAEGYEYNPELFQDQGILEKFLHQMYDVPSISEWEKPRFKRGVSAKIRRTSSMKKTST